MSPLSARAAALAPCLLENAASIDVEGAFPTLEFQWLREAGLLGAEIVNAPTLELLRTLWHVGRGNLAVGRLYEGHVNALQLVDWFGTPEQKQRYFADADDGPTFRGLEHASGQRHSFRRGRRKLANERRQNVLFGRGQRDAPDCHGRIARRLADVRRAD